MPRRPFETEPELSLWKELIELREGDGLTLDRIRHVAHSLPLTSEIHARWKDAPARRDEITLEALAEWVASIPGDRGFALRCAYNLEPSIPEHLRVALRQRRSFAAKAALAPVDTVRSREGAAIENFIRQLTRTALAVETRYPTVEIKNLGEPWQRVDVLPLDRPTSLRKRIRLLHEFHSWRFDANRSLVEEVYETHIRADEPDVRLTGDFLNWPALTFRRVRVEMLTSARVHQLGWIGDDLMIDFEFVPHLQVGDEQVFGYRVLNDGPCADFGKYESGHQEPTDRLEIRIEFDPSELPRRAWWFEDLPFGQTPGPAVTERLIPLSAASPIAYRDFGSKGSDDIYASGIGWEW